jgi:hypothetical protein
MQTCETFDSPHSTALSWPKNVEQENSRKRGERGKEISNVDVAAHRITALQLTRG